MRLALVLGLPAVALALLALGGEVSWWAALVAWVVTLGAVLVGGLIVRAAPEARQSGEPRRSGPDLATRQLLDALPDPAILLDGRGAIRGANGRALATLPGLRPGDPLSFSLRVPDVLEAVKAVAAGGPARTVEFMDRVPVERWTEAHVDAVGPISAGHATEVLLLLRDLTAMRRAERMRVDFVANASHELRTPLASLLGFIETLQGPARNDEAARERFLEIMRGQANRMARLIDDLLSLSRIELKAHLRPSGTVDLRDIVRQVADALGPLAADRGVEIALTLPEEPVLVQGDRDELIRVAENLVENAIKYGADGRRVDVVVEMRDAGPDGSQDVALAVRDHGPGIAWEHLPRLTERFYRVDVGESRGKGGTGLGLALVKHIIARHRGRLDIKSTPGQGATFTMLLERVRNGSAKGEAELPATNVIHLS